MSEPSLMRREIDEAPEAVRRLLDLSGDAMRAAGARLRRLQPPAVATIARGSSDHAATYLKYATEIMAGIPVASLGPSVVSVYGAALKLQGCAAIAVSQSGRSPDIVALAKAARDGGGETIALVNVEGSPLADAASAAVALQAGPERSVAATKSFIASVAAALCILAEWQGDDALRHGLRRLPDDLDAALDCRWDEAVDAVRDAGSLYTLGRGPGYAVAAETALKFKETCIVHAEAYSGAELLHGPVSLVEGGFPVFAYIPQDAAHASLVDTANRLLEKGATLFVAGEGAPGRRLPTAPAGHPLLEPLVMLLSFYGFAEALSRARGFDPDVPRGLKKVTETI